MRLVLSLLCLFAALFAVKADTPLIGPEYTGNVDAQTQAQAAKDVFTRLLGRERSEQFSITIVKKDGNDYFHIAPQDDIIAITASNGVSACRALKWYLNNICNIGITWRGDNLVNLPEDLPKDFAPTEEATPFKYRYIFNNCVFGYETAFWHWEDWEHMIDLLAFNGINMPAMLAGQEKVWQETYKEFGLNKEDLDNFFSGPAWFPWQWMGNLDGWGGPLSQAFIDRHSEMQKKILARSRSLGMTPVLPGFSGHIPKALAAKFPEMKYHKLEWWGFDTIILDWQDPMFTEIGKTFLEKQREIYGTDHYYNIDPFNEMAPPTYERDYIYNMAETIYNSILAGDKDGIWVAMTWFAKIPVDGNWDINNTRNFFDAVPNDRMLAIELWGENWEGTGWYRQDSWFGKPWIWCILQSFGNRVDIYGGLPQIFTNYNKMINSPEKGNIQGMGIMTEGMDFNPVVYELVLDMMWGDGVQDLDAWKEYYLTCRYGKDIPESVRQAWDILFEECYTKSQLINMTQLCFTPGFTQIPDTSVVKLYQAWELMQQGADQLGNCASYQFDLINLGREVMSRMSDYVINRISQAYSNKDVKALEESRNALFAYIADFDKLMGANEYFLLGKWLNDARKWASSPEEVQHMEWCAKRQITDWGGHIGPYSVKEWSGLGTKAAPEWRIYTDELIKSIEENRAADMTAYNNKRLEFYNQWLNTKDELPFEPQGNAVEISAEMLEKCGQLLEEYKTKTSYNEIVRQQGVAGLARNKKVVATNSENGAHPESMLVDGDLTLASSWWATAPATATVDIGAPAVVAGFLLTTYWGDNRYYQYTIDISEDGVTWTTVVDESDNTKVAGPQGILYPIDGTVCRYVRLNMLRNSVNSSVHVVELKVLSPDDMKTIEQQ